MPLFGKSQKSPTEVVKALKDALTALERGDKKSDKVGFYLYFNVCLSLLFILDAFVLPQVCR